MCKLYMFTIVFFFFFRSLLCQKNTPSTAYMKSILQEKKKELGGIRLVSKLLFQDISLPWWFKIGIIIVVPGSFS